MKNESLSSSSREVEAHCDVCNPKGLVLKRRPHPKAPKMMIWVMTTCECPLGRAKEDYLNREKRAGRADNKVLVGR